MDGAIEAIKGLILTVFVLATLLGFFWSVVRILHRMGLSGWWVSHGLWPIMLPCLATCRWPAFEDKRDGSINEMGASKRKPTSKLSDAERHKRFKEMAKEVGARREV